MGTPWSAPARMKTNGALIGGSLSTAQVGAYTDYLVKFVPAYQAKGVPIGYLSVQNEPEFSAPGYPSMTLTAVQEVTVVNALAPKLKAAGLSTKILGYDHNWNDTTYPEAMTTSAGGKDSSSADGAKLQIWSCTGAANQKWTVPTA